MYKAKLIDGKLMLTSTDIRVGDKVKDSTGTLNGITASTPTEEEILSGKYIKVIGPISPEATWVQDGDEFDEDQLEIEYIKTVLSKFNYKELFEVFLQIKGPCGHFH